jgi:hypothetical protein
VFSEPVGSFQKTINGWNCFIFCGKVADDFGRGKLTRIEEK